MPRYAILSEAREATVKRREFITLCGSAAASWPLAARAQQPERVRRIGVLMNMASDDPESQARLSALVKGLQELGWTVGRNVRIDYRWGEGDAERYRRQAAEMFALEPDVIVSWGAEIASGSQKASRAVPIVFAQSIDPVWLRHGREPSAARWQRHRFHPI